MKQKNLLALLVLACLCILAAGAYVFVFEVNMGGADTNTAAVGVAGGAYGEPIEFADVKAIVPETQPAPAAPEREGWRMYENATYRFRVSFPGDYEARQYSEADGAMSLTVSKPSTGEGFQVYVTPYTDDQITEKRFRLDVSSGVMKEPVDVIIAGVRGTMFLSRNSIMGETREVWFINNGFLYEVLTYKQLDEWLAGVMQTWEFL